MATGDDSSLDDELWRQVDAFVQCFEEAWQKGGRPAIDDFLPKDGPEGLRRAVLSELVEVDLERRRRAGEPVRREDYLERYPRLAVHPTQAFAAFPYKPTLSGPPDLPQHIGGYPVDRILGRGGFGIVYLAHDKMLSRPVAIKVPHRELVARPEDAELYLAEARTVAGLKHPNIVPVYHVGNSEDHPFFVVSMFIEGGTLARLIKEKRPSARAAAELVRIVAETLHYAHHHGLVHRDIKPSNILLEPQAAENQSPVPFVADFGLALREKDFGKGAGMTGTPSYMSPEQARGEGHRVDGRSDIFSLGVVFYELLTGVRPFQADTRKGLLEQIRNVDVRPPRQRDDAIPRELERICLKALSRRASERYTTAKDFADDLRHFLVESAPEKPPAESLQQATPDIRPIKIVPKGLRSFDNRDADFFLELLPGPRDREGLPDSIRFWKTKIEETDPDNTFAVGLIYGPSGCGKSSLVKAGLLPRLHKDVIDVYVEAVALETEARVLNGLRKQCPDLSRDLGLAEALAALRRGQGILAGKKVLIVLDQFEQWLHAEKEEANTELVQALRQCDGRRVQCIVMVRDDFWLAVSRFLKELEVRLLEGQNSALVDLFDLDHAKNVLAAFGRAFGKLPENSAETSKEQKQFLEQAVFGLAREGKVICVRLALFVEMMKGKPWTPASLRAVGGTAGVGVTFLEETFSAATAPPEHRYHQHAARGVLKALSPESGTDIKGHMRSYQELLEASGYGERRGANAPAGSPPKKAGSNDFDDLLRILDSEIRLITPTDPEGRDEGGVASEERKTSASSLAPRPSPSATRFYQLTHDYLVHSLRHWLTAKQKETSRGRAELLLADRAAVWNARPENRQLPSLWQWFQIRLLTWKKDWTQPQRMMMHRASRYHVIRALAVALFAVAGIVWGVRSYEQKSLLIAGLLDRLITTEIEAVPQVVSDLTSYRSAVDPKLADIVHAPTSSEKAKLRASLGLLPVDSSQVEYLYRRMLDADPREVLVIRRALVPHKDKLVGQLWVVVEKTEKGMEQQRLRAAAALAMYDPDNQPQWDTSVPNVVEDLVSVNSVFLERWAEAYRPVKARLLTSLSFIFQDRKSERALERTQATKLLADYFADKPAILADLLMDADENQFRVVYPKFKEHGELGLNFLQSELDKQLVEVVEEQAKERLAKRQANAVVAIARMGRPAAAWPLLKHSKDPRVRSHLIHRLGPLGANAGEIIKHLERERDDTIRQALILSLGEFKDTQLPSSEWSKLIERLFAIYEIEGDAGLHAAAEWLLRAWDQDERIKAVEGRLRMSEAAIRKTDLSGVRRWYVNGEGQTMVVIPGPVEFMMGSPPGEADRQTGELQHIVRIGRTFAIAAKAVTVGQYRRFKEDHPLTEKIGPVLEYPVVQTTWYDAAAYCNRLSKEENIDPNQWCYETDTQGKVVKLKEKYLSLTGYRLPTEAEMEFAIRAGTITSRYFGESEELLGKYGWFVPNSGGRIGPVGRLKPNDLGLFDMHGNVWCWCQESKQDYPQGKRGQVFEDKEHDLNINPDESRVLRGDCYTDHASGMRSASRYGQPPARKSNLFGGFRVARTITAE